MSLGLLYRFEMESSSWRVWVPNRALQLTVTGVLRAPAPAAERERYASAPPPYVACCRSSRTGGIRVEVRNDRTARLGIQAEAAVLAGQEMRSPSFKKLGELGRPSVSVLGERPQWPQ
jgi:hypothetical protein